MRWCELNGVDYLFGLARNVRLTAAITAELEAARHHSERTGRPARRFTDFMWSTLDSWSRERRVVAKAEWTGGGANPRFLVTSLSRAEHQARHLYEKLYCARGEMENRIKECQLEVVCAKFSKLVMAGGLAEPGSKLASLCSIGQTHPFVPTCLPAERRAQPRSRLAVGHRRRRRAAVWTAASTVPS